MYLKTIEIQGFKSFAHKISFQFHNGITAIVGPNGSGKSNVADAVRWVLGEQRIKQLRGANMQDIIFSGTETRKPLSYATVSITLDNSDHQLPSTYEEVTVARRIYRSGESEYLLNGSVCRLKDVNEMFYDTGIGKEGYSIIGQGQIDKILSGKPEERRELFDEAAGIVKFKRRKTSALQKLEAEKQNLVRVKDILSELEKQIEPLEKRSTIARTYLKKRDELKAFEISIFIIENKQLKQQLQGIEEKYELAYEQLEETKKRYENIKTEYDQMTKDAEVLDGVIEDRRLHLSDTELMREKLEGQINVLKEQIHTGQEAAQELLDRSEKVKQDKTAKEEERFRLQTQFQTIIKDHADLTAQFLAAKQDLQSVQNRVLLLTKRIETEKNTIIEELNERAAIRSTLGRLENMAETALVEHSQIKDKILLTNEEQTTRVQTLKSLE
ncbi:MAG: AAA family ATPase, partial [Lachnospiraceae bacterium]|nr:AAA family ATPase [Lachnospiraceae bacterium]